MELSSFISQPSPTLKVVFFTYSEWAFGSIHEALCRELYKHGIIATLLDWNGNYPRAEIARLSKLYDYFVTHPGSGVSVLYANGVPYDKIIAVAHETTDIESGVNCQNEFEKFREYAVINSDLIAKSRELGIEREPKVVTNGIHFDLFYDNPASRLSRLGYAGSLVSLMCDGVTDRKRGYLSSQLADRAGLLYNLAEHHGYRTMPMFYRNVDSVVVTSIQESCGLPIMEAAAAGKLPIGTPVGMLKKHGDKTGIVLPMEPDKFITEGVEILSHFKQDPVSFSRKCKEVQDFARETYDWPKVIDSWLTLFD